MKKIIISIPLILISNLCYAGINVEARRVEKNGITGDLQISGSFKKGNTNFINFGFSSFINYQNKNNSFLGFGSINFTSEDIEKNAIQNSSLAHLRYNLFIDDKLSFEIFNQIESDKNKFIALRILKGTGLRFKILSKNNYNFLSGSSVMIELEKFNNSVIPPYPSELTNSQSIIFRWNNYSSIKIDLTDQFLFQSIVYYQPRFDRFKDYKIYNDNILLFKIKENTSFGISGGISYDNEPPIACNDNKCNRLSKVDGFADIQFSIKF